jgi:MFS family permease
VREQHFSFNPTANILATLIGLGQRWANRRSIPSFAKHTLCLPSTPCVAVFGAFSLVSAFAHSLFQLPALRFLTGVGLGGGIPLAIALASDFARPMRQGRLVILMSAGVPIGLTLGGLLASQLVQVFNRPAIFVVRGVLPFAMIPVLALWLPDSVIPKASTSRRNPAIALFGGRLAPCTALLWAMNFLNLLSNLLILLWTPAIRMRLA